MNTFLEDLTQHTRETYLRRRPGQHKIVIAILLMIAALLVCAGGLVGVSLLIGYVSGWFAFLFIPWLLLTIFLIRFADWYLRKYI